MEMMDTIADTTTQQEKKRVRVKDEGEKERKLNLPRLIKMAAVKAILLAAPVYGV